MQNFHPGRSCAFMDRVGEIFPIDDDDDDAPAVQATTLPLHWMVHRSLASSYYYSSGLSLSSVPVVCCCNNFINTLYIYTRRCLPFATDHSKRRRTVGHGWMQQNMKQVTKVFTLFQQYFAICCIPKSRHMISTV